MSGKVVVEGSEGLKKALELELKRKKRFLWDFGLSFRGLFEVLVYI